jgi:phage baseplate assembly protein gpV
MTFYIKQNDTSPHLSATLKDADGNLIDLTSATVRFHMRKIGGSTALVDAAATVVAEDAGSVRYNWQAEDTETPGSFHAEFEVTYASGDIETFPNDSYVSVEITDDIT